LEADAGYRTLWLPGQTTPAFRFSGRSSNSLKKKANRRWMSAAKNLFAGLDVEGRIRQHDQ
jgi:hypothetical protein